ncbi:MAG: sodium:proton antiporter [Deltaproteobacteria bacterium]|nr:sodium:proton antiporter [Deltaproteobacteria bacterium]
MIKKALAVLLLAQLCTILFSFLSVYQEPTSLNAVSSHYIHNEPKELGAANAVTAVVVTYRGLDTLGEVTILFAASVVVGLLMFLHKNESAPRRDGSELLKTGASLLFPLILLFGAYVFINGHLSPGGGFQGGAIIASALMLTILANPNRHVGHGFFWAIESISGFVFVLLGIAGLVLAGGFLDSRVLPPGTFGHVASAGLIPVIYIFVGLKVGAELSSVVLSLHGKSEGGVQHHD